MNAIIEYALNFSFKGSRQYVHLTDMYAVVMEAISGETPLAVMSNVVISCKKHTNRQLNLTRSRPVGDDLVAVFSITVENQEYTFYLQERDELVSERRPYPEEEIVAAATLTDNHTAVLTHCTEMPFTPVEMVVALNKRLHQTRLPDVQGGWVAVYINTRQPLYRIPVDRIEVRGLNFRSERLTKSLIILDGVEAGEIRFALKKYSA